MHGHRWRPYCSTCVLCRWAAGLSEIRRTSINSVPPACRFCVRNAAETPCSGLSRIFSLGRHLCRQQARDQPSLSVVHTHPSVCALSCAHKVHSSMLLLGFESYASEIAPVAQVAVYKDQRSVREMTSCTRFECCHEQVCLRLIEESVLCSSRLLPVFLHRTVRDTTSSSFIERLGPN